MKRMYISPKREKVKIKEMALVSNRVFPEEIK